MKKLKGGLVRALCALTKPSCSSWSSWLTLFLCILPRESRSTAVMATLLCPNAAHVACQRGHVMRNLRLHSTVAKRLRDFGCGIEDPLVFLVPVHLQVVRMAVDAAQHHVVDGNAEQAETDHEHAGHRT